MDDRIKIGKVGNVDFVDFSNRLPDGTHELEVSISTNYGVRDNYVEVRVDFYHATDRDWSRTADIRMTVDEWVQFCKATFEMLGLPNATCGCAAGEMLADEPDIYTVDDGEAVKDE